LPVPAFLSFASGGQIPLEQLSLVISEKKENIKIYLIGRGCQPLPDFQRLLIGMVDAHYFLLFFLLFPIFSASYLPSFPLFVYLCG
jgi:hypothetical protein